MGFYAHCADRAFYGPGRRSNASRDLRTAAEHAGNYLGTNYGWQKYFAGLEQVAAGVP
jgi:hypothetical protein